MAFDGPKYIDLAPMGRREGGPATGWFQNDARTEAMDSDQK